MKELLDTERAHGRSWAKALEVERVSSHDSLTGAGGAGPGALGGRRARCTGTKLHGEGEATA